MNCLLTISLSELLLADNAKASGKREKYQAAFYLVSEVPHRPIVSHFDCFLPAKSESICLSRHRYRIYAGKAAKTVTAMGIAFSILGCPQGFQEAFNRDE